MMDIVTFGFYLSIFLFAGGLLLSVVKKNIIFILIGIELMLNAANLNILLFNTQFSNGLGELVAVFVVVLAAAEAGIALAILLLVFRHYRSIDITELKKLRY